MLNRHQVLSHQTLISQIPSQVPWFVPDCIPNMRKQSLPACFSWCMGAKHAPNACPNDRPFGCHFALSRLQWTHRQHQKCALWIWKNTEKNVNDNAQCEITKNKIKMPQKNQCQQENYSETNLQCADITMHLFCVLMRAKTRVESIGFDSNQNCACEDARRVNWFWFESFWFESMKFGLCCKQTHGWISVWCQVRFNGWHHWRHSSAGCQWIGFQQTTNFSFKMTLGTQLSTTIF